MDLEKLKPWNWFKHEEGGNGNTHPIPVKRSGAGGMPAGTGGSLLHLHDEMDRWFDNAFKSFGLPSLTDQVEPRFPAIQRPRIDICGDDNCYQISLDVPGLSEEDLSLEVSNDVLTIKGEKEESSENRDKEYYRIERSYGSFQRTLSLPDDANADEIKANLEKGVLNLEIPRRAESRQDVKRIPISS